MGSRIRHASPLVSQRPVCLSATRTRTGEARGVTEQRASPAAEVLAEVLSFGPRWSRRRAAALHRQQRQQEGLDLVCIESSSSQSSE